MKNKRHDKLVKDYDRQKSKHLDNLATKMLKNQEKTDMVLAIAPMVNLQIMAKQIFLIHLIVFEYNHLSPI